MADLQPSSQTQQRVSRGSSSSSEQYSHKSSCEVYSGAEQSTRSVRCSLSPLYEALANAAHKHSIDVYRCTEVLYYSVVKWIERVAGRISELLQLIRVLTNSRMPAKDERQRSVGYQKEHMLS